MAAIFLNHDNTQKNDFFQWLPIQIHSPHKYSSFYKFSFVLFPIHLITILTQQLASRQALLLWEFLFHWSQW